MNYGFFPDDLNSPPPRACTVLASSLALGLLVDIEIDFSTRNGNVRVFINKALSTETGYHLDVINRDRLGVSVSE